MVWGVCRVERGGGAPTVGGEGPCPCRMPPVQNATSFLVAFCTTGGILHEPRASITGGILHEPHALFPVCTPHAPIPKSNGQA